MDLFHGERCVNVHYECDYRKQVEDELAKILEMPKPKVSPEETVIVKGEFSRILEIVHLKESQYRLVISKERWNLIVNGYSALKDVAMVQGGKVVLDITEDGMDATLSYTGRELFQTDEQYDKTAETIRTLLTHFPDMWLKAENNEFTFTISAHLYDKILIQDLSEEIQQKQEELREWTKQKKYEDYL